MRDNILLLYRGLALEMTSESYTPCTYPSVYKTNPLGQVEPACGVSIAPAYNGTLPTLLFPELSEVEFSKLNVVIVVCGGSKVTLEILEDYKKTYGDDARVVKNFHARRLASEKKDNTVKIVD